jgi:hypothetical protein
MLIYKWYKLFDQIGNICEGKGPGRRPVSDAQVDVFYATFIRISCKSIRFGVHWFNMSLTMVLINLWNSLNLKDTLLQYVMAHDKEVYYTFCSDPTSILEDELLQTTVLSVMKPHSVYWEMLIDTA